MQKRQTKDDVPSSGANTDDSRAVVELSSLQQDTTDTTITSVNTTVTVDEDTSQCVTLITEECDPNKRVK